MKRFMGLPSAGLYQFNSKKVIAFIIAVVCVLIVVVIVQGINWLVFSFLPLAIVLALVIYGQLEELLGAIVLIALINQIGNEAHALLRIWIEDPRIEQTISYFMKLSGFNGFLLIFFILSSVDILTSAVKIFRTNVSNEASSKVGE